MKKITEEVKNMNKVQKEKPVVNFMGGISYELNPLDTLKMISASSIFGEPAYYRDGIEDGSAYLNKLVEPYLIFDMDEKKTSDIMVDAINKALEYDFKATIDWALDLRNNFFMRLNPQVIMVLASTHPARAKFAEENPGYFRELNKKIMRRADEPATQLAVYLWLNKGKQNIPSVLKRSWADRIGTMSRYEMAKYKNAEMGLINTVRICHAKSDLVDELMKTGTVTVEDEELTWNNLRSEGKTWKEILETTKVPHFALLKNLRGIFSELTDEDKDLADKVLEDLKAGVLNGKLFPFRYYKAKQILDGTNINFKGKVLDILDECIDISIKNLPKLKGKTACLSDNSGSAWGSIPSEYGSVCIAEINNLSSVITAVNSDEGEVGIFGDKLEMNSISKRDGILSQTMKMTEGAMNRVGGSTENGIWLFLKDAIENKKHYDNIFIYSDMQTGHGGLYGVGRSYAIEDEDFTCNGHYIDVMKLINKYRTTVNPKVNVFCVQTAGYDNILIPEYTYRGAVLYGWTGKEILFASELINQWDEIEKRN